MRFIFITLCLLTHAFAFDWKTDILSGDFTSESHPKDERLIRKEERKITHAKNDTWICYEKFDFGSGTTYAWIEVAADKEEGAIELRVGSSSGTVIGKVNLKNTGSLEAYKPLGVTLLKPVEGVQDLYLNFVGGIHMNCSIGKFRFQRFAPDYKSPNPIVPWIKRNAVKTTPAGSFTTESHPSDAGQTRSENGAITYIGDGNWVGYKDFDFGSGANFATIQGSSQNAGGTVELRIGHPTSGQPIGTVIITGTGSYSNYLPFSTDLGKTVTGVQDLYFRFVGKGWAPFNIKDFYFQQLDPAARSTGRVIAAHQFDKESSPGVDEISESGGISSLSGGGWVCYEKFDFGQGANIVTVMAATPNKGGAVEMWIDSPDGLLKIATLDVTHTGSWTHFREYTAKVTKEVRGVYNLYVGFVDTHQQSESLFNLKNFVFENQAPPSTAPSHEGTLHVYGAVPGLDPSPYYTYSVQKVSALNAPLKQNASNWLSPFAWFTECKSPGMPYGTGYYMQEIAGWSHTYCNFEMGKNTPIVVKITRKDTNEAASGPIFMANVHPAHKVQSCEVINGEVYVTMHEPALVTVDIDGQMDTRDAPRSAPAEMASSKPYASKLHGSHAVSIFANPVIPDKPEIGGPGVKYIKPGDALPKYDDPSWKTLYFGKGVHHFSRDKKGKPAIWKNGDAYILMSDKTCYISGDAMIYGNFDGRAENSPKHRVRVYGYGTISGAKMPHWDDPYWDEKAQVGTEYHDRPIAMSSGYDCRFEGVTCADPANHGIAFDFGAVNARRWIKQISWRANSDMGGIPGVIEDCFYRLQDDGPYVSSGDVRRTTFWFDCNGAPFRGSFITSGTVAPGHQTVIEDCDIIYARANWGGSVIGASDFWGIGTYPDGTRNTAQHVIFRNIRVTDPRPTRTFFGFDVPENVDSGIAGIRFDNVEYRHPHSWGAASSFTGTVKGPIHHCYFDKVSINGKAIDETTLADPNLFRTAHTSNMIFKKTPPEN